jgi:hypothetical protein
VQRDEKLDVDDAISRQLKALTSVMHGADAAAARRHIDRSALFIDQAGAESARTDFTGGPATLGDWVVHHTDDVAITSFTLKTATTKVLAVEIWRARGPKWLLVAGQTISLNTDPPAAALPDRALEAYVGVYSAGPGSVARVARDGPAITLALGEGKSGALTAERLDRFYTPGLPAGYLRPHCAFFRGADGSVAGFERSGILYHRIDPADVGAPAPSPPPGALKLRAFKVRQFGDLAVAAFYHDRDTPVYGQVLRQTYRSMETWIHRDGGWKMISSQGRQIEPPARTTT